MGLRQLPDKTYHAWITVLDTNGQEVSFSGYGNTRGEALNRRDDALATGLKAFPGLKTPKAPDSPHARDNWDYPEPQKPPAPCITIIEHADGRTSRRDMDWNDRDARRRFLRKVGEMCKAGEGRISITPDQVVVEGVVP